MAALHVSRRDPAADRRAGRSGSRGFRDRLLRTPLFWKLFGAQLLGLSLVLFVSFQLLPGRETGGQLLLVAVLTLAIAAGLSGWVLRAALRPVEDLAETARRVTLGDWRARAPASPFADERTEQLGRVLNEMLDAVGLAQRTQRDLSRRVLESEERHRERIAHELYAGTAQTLAGVLVRLRVLARQLSGDADAAGLAEISAEIRGALQEIRSVARRLRPPELDELGVQSALEAHARTLSDGTDIDVSFSGLIPEERLSADARLGLFRIVQEALSNAFEHASPSRVDVFFHATANGLRVEVIDDGCGFEVPTAGRVADFSNLGIVGMRERAEYAQGTLAIRSAPGEGTAVSLILPFVRGVIAAGANGVPAVAGAAFLSTD